jgi:hypothetical protein
VITNLTALENVPLMNLDENRISDHNPIVLKLETVFRPPTTTVPNRKFNKSASSLLIK